MANRVCGWTFAVLVAGNGFSALVGNASPPTSAPATTTASTTTASTTTVSGPVPFCSTKYGFSVQLPEDWSPVCGAADEPFSLIPVDDAGGKELAGVPIVKMTVPVLPFHIPGLIPVGSVANGYVDDLRKQYPDVKVDERIVVSIPSASARRVLSSYHCGQACWRDIVLCIVHKDRVFLLQADCPIDDYTATQTAFDAIAGSLKWN